MCLQAGDEARPVTRTVWPRMWGDAAFLGIEASFG